MSELSLLEFIEMREAEIKERRRILLEELKQLKAARAAIAGVSGNRPVTQAPASTRELTIKEMALDVVSSSSSPLTAEEILAEMNKKFLKDIQRTSLSPQLSRLRQDERLDYDPDSGRWGLPVEVAKKLDGEADSQNSGLDDCDIFG